jgi:redox-sensing transcriptional repressor
MPKHEGVSLSVIKRLPRYYRFLGDLLKKDVTRISSRELAQLMRLTASQIRQDLNCFGGFGQQGYGYNVAALHNEIGNILGLNHLPVLSVGRRKSRASHCKAYEF